MFNFLKKCDDAPLVPQIVDPVKLEKKRKELHKLICVAAKDGIISPIEDAEISSLAVQVGVNRTDLKKMINFELIPQFKEQVLLFAKDGKIDNGELLAIKKRAEELDVSKEELSMIVSEALSMHKEDVKQKFLVALSGIGIVLAAVGVGVVKSLWDGNVKCSVVCHKSSK